LFNWEEFYQFHQFRRNKVRAKSLFILEVLTLHFVRDFWGPQIAKRQTSRRNKNFISSQKSSQPAKYKEMLLLSIWRLGQVYLYNTLLTGRWKVGDSRRRVPRPQAFIEVCGDGGISTEKLGYVSLTFRAWAMCQQLLPTYWAGEVLALSGQTGTFVSFFLYIFCGH
jgi:hypothetical protein